MAQLGYSDCWVDDARLVALNAAMPPTMAPPY
jgi:glycerol-3-phosphate dehydrogenase